MTQQHVVELRSAGPDDASIIVGFLQKLAAYQDLSDEVCITPEVMRAQLAPGASPQLFVIIAEVGGIPAGMVVYYMAYSTFRGKWGIHVEDIYIEETYRKKGIGRGIFTTLARFSGEHGYERITFSVLASNTDARRLYEKVLGATPLPEWIPMRLDGHALNSLHEHPERVGVQKFRPN